MSFTPAKGVVVCDLHAEVAQSASKGGIDDAPQLTFSMLRRSKRFALYGVIMSGLALVWVGITVPDPYLLPWADSRGLMGWQAGILFSAQPLAVVLIQPAIPALARQPGYLGLLPFGLVLAALASAGIAAAPSWGGSGTKLFLILVISDLIAGTAEGIVETCSYTLLAKSFNDVLGQAVGHAEAWIGIGTFAGPFIGGVLFSLGGFSCPSAALSVALFALTAWTMFTTNANLNCYSCLAGGEADQKTQEDDEKRIWRADGIVFVAAATSAMLSGSVTGIYAPLLSEYYTRDFMWSEAFVGQLFALSGAIYMTVASLVGHYCDRGGPVALRATIVCGGVCASAALLFCTSAEPLQSVAGLQAIGLSTAMLQVPVLALLEQSVPKGKDAGLPASVNNGCHALGSGLSPLLVLPLRELVGFETAMRLCSGLAACVAVILAAAFAMRPLPSQGETS